MRARRRFQRVNVLGWLLVFAIALLAEIAIQLFDLHDTVSPPSETVTALAEGLASGELLAALRTTLEAYISGLALAIVVGVVVGVLIGSSRLLLDASFVVLEFLRPIPAVALIPLAILFFGLGTEMRRYVIAYAAVWPILINTLYGVRGSDRILHEVAIASGVGRLGRLVRVTLPSASPSIATGIRVSASIALLVAVTAEFVTGSEGVGAYMQQQQLAFQLPEMYAAVLLTGPSRVHHQRRTPTHRAPRPALERRAARQVGVSSALGRIGRPLLGLAVFGCALVLWELWARAEGSFLVPTASDVVERAWEIWPTREFLTEVAASLRRLAAGFTLGAATGVAIGLVMGASLGARRRSIRWSSLLGRSRLSRSSLR